ncbi:signal peptidase II [Helicobacter fennelliae]
MTIYARALLIIIAVICVDQLIKMCILQGFRWESKALSIVLVYNNGVAFSMFASLGAHLKWIQVGFLLVVMIYVCIKSEALRRYYLGICLMLGGGISNVIDRFIHSGVVDYVYWHYGFEFAIFNLADVMIDCGVVILMAQWLWLDKKRKPRI